jgi:hypothetical protein
MLVHDEHFAASKKEKSSTHFCFVYSSTKGKRHDKRDKLGCFKHLTQIIAAGFDPTSEPAMHIKKVCKEGGLLIISQDDQHRILSCLKKELTAVKIFRKWLLTFLKLGRT